MDCLDHRLLPGEGDANVAEFAETLLSTGVDCPISVEIISIAQRARSLREAAASSFAAASKAINPSTKGRKSARSKRWSQYLTKGNQHDRPS